MALPTTIGISKDEIGVSENCKSALSLDRNRSRRIVVVEDPSMSVVSIELVSVSDSVRFVEMNWL